MVTNGVCDCLLFEVLERGLLGRSGGIERRCTLEVEDVDRVGRSGAVSGCRRRYTVGEPRCDEADRQEHCRPGMGRAPGTP